MKIRMGLVSNSSSSSFMVHRKDITYEQGLMIEFVCNEQQTDWKLERTYGTLIGYTSLDNFYMPDFFDRIGIEKRKVKWSRSDASEPYKDGKYPAPFSKKYYKIKTIAYQKAKKIMMEMSKEI